MDDIISRQAAMLAVSEVICKCEQETCCSAVMVLSELPSAQRKGKWIYLDGLEAFECSVCGRQMVRNIFDYCPWCGARMVKGENDESTLP